MFEIGNSLREARLRQGLEFSEVEQATKIRGKYLRALEDEQFDILPGQTYVKGFLRTYAEYLGLDGQLYVDEYNSRYIPGDAETPLRAQSTSVGRNPRVESSVVLVALAAIGIVTALVVVAWRYGSDTPETAIPDFSAQPPAVTKARPKTKTRAVRRPPVLARTLVTAPFGDSWMEVRAGSAGGRQLYEGTVLRGQAPLRFSRHRRLYVVLGRPGNLRMRVNGRWRRMPIAEPGAVLVTPRGIAAASTTG
jgi:cytoskeleton protein RodZ